MAQKGGRHLCKCNRDPPDPKSWRTNLCGVGTVANLWRRSKEECPRLASFLLETEWLFMDTHEAENLNLDQYIYIYGVQ